MGLTAKEIILSKLSHDPISRSDLKEICHVSDRDIRHAIEQLRIEGYPICSSARRKGYWIARDSEELRACIMEYYSRSARLRLTANIMEKNLDVFKEQMEMELC